MNQTGHAAAGTTASATLSTARKVVRIGVLSSITKLDPREALDNISGLVLEQIFETPYTIAYAKYAQKT